jgi:hypothetical protein
VHSKRTNSFTLLLTSVFIVLADVKTPINRVSNVVKDEGFKLFLGSIVVAAFGLRGLRIS